jgi:hypothetical protein
MKRTKADPSLVYQYDCSVPLVNADKVNEQLMLASRYRNLLVEIHLDHRKLYNETVLTLSEPLIAIGSDIDSLSQQIDALFTEKSSQRQVARKRVKTPDLDAKIKALKSIRKELYASLKALKKDCAGHPRISELNECKNLLLKDIRNTAAHSWGLHWGTYLTVEDAAKDFHRGTPPKFKGFKGTGTLAVQLQSNTETRITPVDILGVKNDLIQIRTEGKHTYAKFLIGVENSLKKRSKNNPPVYTEVKFVMHRPLPLGYISWVKLIAKRVASKLVWKIQFIMASPAGFAKPCGDGTCSLDLGYRQVAGGLRIGYWVGDDGDGGELILSDAIISAFKQVADLQSMRDEKFNRIKIELATLKSVMPEWLQEDIKYIANWKRKDKLHYLVTKWRNNRHPGDEIVYNLAEAWRQEDKHHWEWAENLRLKTIAQRDNYYGQIGAMLRRKYGTIKLEDIDLREHAQSEDLNTAVQKQRDWVSHSTLRKYLNMNILWIDPRYTSMKCHVCGHINPRSADTFITCENCNAMYDRDENAAINILRELQCYEKRRECSQASKSVSDKNLDNEQQFNNDPEDVAIKRPLEIEDVTISEIRTYKSKSDNACTEA